MNRELFVVIVLSNICQIDPEMDDEISTFIIFFKIRNLKLLRSLHTGNETKIRVTDSILFTSLKWFHFSSIFFKRRSCLASTVAWININAQWLLLIRLNSSLSTWNRDWFGNTCVVDMNGSVVTVFHYNKLHVLLQFFCYNMVTWMIIIWVTYLFNVIFVGLLDLFRVWFTFVSFVRKPQIWFKFMVVNGK